MSDSADKRWIKLGKSEALALAQISKINDDEFVVVPPQSYLRNQFISKYNARTNEWKKLMEYPQDVIISQHGIATNAATNSLYLTTSRSAMLISDIKTGQFDIKYLRNKKSKLVCHGNFRSSLLNVDGTIHLIGGDMNDKHLIWDDDNNEFKEIYEFDRDEVGVRYSPSLIYAKRKQKIFLFGGQFGPRKKTRIWMF